MIIIFIQNPSGQSVVNQLDAQNVQVSGNICLDSGVCLSQISRLC